MGLDHSANIVLHEVQHLVSAMVHDHSSHRQCEFYSLPAQDVIRRGAIARQSAGFPTAQARAASVGLLRARLSIQSVVNAFADTFAYQAALGAFAVLLVLLLGRGRALHHVRQSIVTMLR